MQKISIVLRIALLMSVIATSDASAFNWAKCFNSGIKQKSGGIGTTVFVGMMNSSISYAQFTTSTGECSALGMNKDEQKKMFYYVNFEQLKNEMSKGGGERLVAFYSIYNCSQRNMTANTDYLKKNFRDFAKDDAESSYALIDPIISSSCR